jgi:hypothetical protein
MSDISLPDQNGWRLCHWMVGGICSVAEFGISKRSGKLLTFKSPLEWPVWREQFRKSNVSCPPVLADGSGANHFTATITKNRLEPKLNRPN